MKNTLMVLSVVLFAIGCDNTFIDPSSECETSADCADGDPCTVDVCDVDNTCIQIPSDNPACEPPPDCVPTEEVCNGRDDDCDGETDADAIDRFLIYFDRDGDGFGFDTPTATSSHCPTEDMPPGYVTNADDCNDSDAAVNPDAQELCDEIDNDCDGETDEDVVTETRYRDSDGDGYGDPEFSGIVCHDAPPSSGVLVAGDCDDSDAAVNPESPERCNGWDDNCNGETDEYCGGCDEHADCDDRDDCTIDICDVFEVCFYVLSHDPACEPCVPADEVCNGADDDCDTMVDEDCP